jgi:hypothetical protein
MSARAENLGPYLHELWTEAKKLAEQFGQAAENYAEGDEQWAYNTLNIAHNNVSSVTDLWNALLKDFEAQGFTPKLTEPKGTSDT